MPVLRHRPAPPLDRFIECLWWSRRAAPQRLGEHMLPSGTAQLVVALHDDPFGLRGSGRGDEVQWRGSVIHGPQSGFYATAPKPAGEVVGVSFRPGGAAVVLGLPLAWLVDRHVELASAWGARASNLRERLLAARDVREMFGLLEADLLAGLRPPLLIHPAIARTLTLACDAADAQDAARVDRWRRACGYSPRHFAALFSQSVGLAPKRFLRIRRFERAARQLAGGAAGGLADVAAATGYADQSHLAREFKALAGVSPSGYRGESDSPLHHRLDAGAIRGGQPR